MRILLSLLKASAVSAAVFSIAWIRLPHLASSLEMALGLFVGFGLLILILSMFIGLPLILIIEWLRIGRSWVYTTAATVVGAVIGGVFTYRPMSHNVEVENPFTLTLSPWTRDTPGFAENPPYSISDFVGSAIFGAIVGAAFGLAFWYFYSRVKRGRLG